MFQIQAESLFFVYCVLITVLVSALWLMDAVKRATPKSDISSERLCR